MQNSLSIEKGLFPILKTSESKDACVVCEAQGFEKDFENAGTTGGFFDLSVWGTVEIAGEDAADYLQRMTTVNFRTLENSRVAHGAFLTGKGTVICLGFFMKAGNGVYHFIVPENQTKTALEHIEKFHFQEKFTVTDKSGEYALLAWWNPNEKLLRDLNIGSLEPLQFEWRRWQSLDMEFWKDDRRPLLYWIKTKRVHGGPLMFELGRLGIPLLGMRLFHYFRMLSGVPWVGSEVGEKDIILETGFEEAVSRNKGCYPGQEVVERIFTYGSVNRKLLPVKLECAKGTKFPECPIRLDAGEKSVGEVVSLMSEPGTPNRAIGLAYIRKEFWDSGEKFEPVHGVSLTIAATGQAAR